MSGSNRLGPLVTIGNIRDACLRLAGRDDPTPRGYLPDYLYDAAIAEGQAGAWIAQPRSWRMAANVRKWPSQALPAVFVAIPGTTAPPKMRGDGTYAAVWQVAWMAVLAGKDDVDTDAQASIYEAAMRAMFLQHAGGLPGLTVERNTWTGSSEDEVTQAGGHDLNYVRIIGATFELELDAVASARQAIDTPSTPPLGPAAPYPTADTVTVTTVKTPT